MCNSPFIAVQVKVVSAAGCLESRMVEQASNPRVEFLLAWHSEASIVRKNDFCSEKP